MVFLLPFMFNWTTNLSAAFFWLTWTTFVFSFSPTRVEILGTVIVRVIFFALPSTVMFLFDMFMPAAASVFKRRGVEGLPGGRKTLNLRRREFKVAGWSLLNLAISIVLQGTLELFFRHTLGRKTMLKVSSILPFPGTWAKHLFLGLALRGVSEIEIEVEIKAAEFFLKLYTENQPQPQINLTDVPASIAPVISAAPLRPPQRKVSVHLLEARNLAPLPQGSIPAHSALRPPPPLPDSQVHSDVSPRRVIPLPRTCFLRLSGDHLDRGTILPLRV